MKRRIKEPAALTSTQEKVFQYIIKRQQQGFPATYQEISKEFRWKSVSTARDHVEALVKKGRLTQTGKSRGLVVTHTIEMPRVSDVNGSAAAAESPRPGSLGVEILSVLEPFLKKKHFRTGTTLWRMGEAPKFLLRIDKGRVRISRPLGETKVVTLYYFSPGDIFGFLPLLDKKPYPADALVVEDLDCSILTSQEFDRVLDTNPTLAGALLRIVGHRFRDAFDKVEALSFKGATARVAAYLLELLSDSKDPSTKAPVIRLPLPSHQLAELLGVMPESLSRAVTRLAATGVIKRLGKGRLQVLKMDGLTLLAQTGGLSTL